MIEAVIASEGVCPRIVGAVAGETPLYVVASRIAWFSVIIVGFSIVRCRDRSSAKPPRKGVPIAPIIVAVTTMAIAVTRAVTTPVVSIMASTATMAIPAIATTPAADQLNGQFTGCLGNQRLRCCQIKGH
jgi:hypothetical protein